MRTSDALHVSLDEKQSCFIGQIFDWFKVIASDVRKVFFVIEINSVRSYSGLTKVHFWIPEGFAIFTRRFVRELDHFDWMLRHYETINELFALFKVQRTHVMPNCSYGAL